MVVVEHFACPRLRATERGQENLKRAPGFERTAWPDVNDTAWRRSIYDYYGAPATVVREPASVVREKPVYVEHRTVRPRRQMSVPGAILLVFLVLGLAWFTYLVSTRGWEQAKQDVSASVQ